MTRTAFVLAVVVLTLLARPAAAQTWTAAAADGGNWNNAANWSPAVVPNSATADAVFTITGVGNVTLLSGVTARSLTFTNGSGSYNLNSTTATLSGLQSITIGSSPTVTQTINLGNVASGSLLFPGQLFVTNNSTAAGPTLLIGPNTVIGSPGSGGVTFAGPGVTQLSGSFATGTTFVAGGLTKTGPGTLNFSGSGASLAGGIALIGGTVQLNYASNTASKLNTGALSLSGGVLTFIPNATVGVTQAISAGTAVNAAQTDIQGPTSGTSNTLNLGLISRTAGATLNFSGTAPAFTVATSTGSINSLLGTGPAFATANGGATWASVSGGTVVPLTSYGTNTFVVNTNVDVSGNQSPAPFAAASLRFNSSAATLTLTGTNTIQSGGILVTTTGNGATITGGSLSSNELIVHAYGDVTINSGIIAANGLTKAGPGTLTLGTFNGSLTGPVNVNRGNLTLTNPDAVTAAAALNFNDNRAATQMFTVQLAADAAATISKPIQFAAAGGGATGFNNVVTTGTTENSRITLGGVISSAPGTVTPIRFQGPAANTSGFNLTAANTFTGDVSLFQGFLGITSNASLGNPANTLFLDTFGTSSGGLEFLNGGIDVARPVVITTASRIVSNGGDVNTISGTVAGGSPLFKDGIGTLVLSGANTQSGLTINAGTVRVAADANLGGGGGTQILIGSGATLAVTGTFATARNINVGPFGGAGPGTSTIDVAAGQTLTLTGPITSGPFIGAAGTLLKTGGGTLVIGSTSNTFNGGTTVQQGVLQAASDGSLGAAAAPVTVGPAGTLVFNSSTSTTRMFTLNSGTLSAGAGAAITLNGANVFGGFLRGTGQFVLTGGAAISGTTTFAATSLNVTGPASLVNFSNGGVLSVTAGPAAPLTLNGFTHQGSGSMTVSAGSQVNATEFQTYGVMNVAPNSLAAPSQLTNIGTTPLFFSGGSRTFIATPATAGTMAAGIDLHGKNAVVAGGLFVNNGFLTDTTAGSPGRVVADFGALVKGAGFFQSPVVTQNGGKFQAGNSPGVVTFGSFTFGPGGVSNYVFAVNDATGMAGPTPDAAGQVSGWGFVKSVGDFTWTADATQKLIVSLETLVNPTTAGIDVAGPMAHFDPAAPYSWPAVTWAGSYAGPADAAALDAATAFDTAGFLNPVGGRFGWALDAGGHTLSLTYTPVPEPGTLALAGLALGALAARACRRRAG